MGIIQNLRDKIFMTIGKTEKVFPVKVEKHRLQGRNQDGEPEIILEGMDRGRTLIKDGQKKFQLMNEERSEGLVKYEDFNQDLEGEKYVSVLKTDRDSIIPLTRNYQVDEDFEESGMSELQYILQTPRMKEMAINQFEEDAKIVETSNETWYMQPKIQSAMLFVGAGLFFIFVGIASGETYLGEATEQMASLEDALRNNAASNGGAP